METETVAETVTETEVQMIRYSEPIQIDFAEIRKRGTLRMITSYGSDTYFLHNGMDRGFEFNLVSRFARENGLKIEVVLVRQGDDPVEMLNRGEGDLIADNLAINQEYKSDVNFSKPYNIDTVLLYDNMRTTVKENLVTGDEDITIPVRKNSFHYLTLRSLQDRGYNIRFKSPNDGLSRNAVMFEVADGRSGAAGADSDFYHVTTSYSDGIEAGIITAITDTLAWAVRKNSPELKQKVDEFMTKHFRVRESDGRILRSAYLNALRTQYFEEDKQLSRFRDQALETIQTGYLSPYDDMVRPIAEEAGVDWKLVIAVMAQESAFNPTAQSRAGALGLMQIIPRFSKVHKSQLYDPETNIREGVRYLKKHLTREAHLDSLNRHSFALAAYNVGIGNLTDARELAVQLGKDPNEWENIADALLKLMNREYYQHARFGYKRGTETVNYVEDVMNRYSRYLAVYELAAQREERGVDFLVGLSR